MKKTIISIQYRLAFLFMAMLTTVYAIAQDQGTEGGSTTVSKTTSTHTEAANAGDWYAAPWVWIVGVAVFILLLFAIIRGNSSKTDVTRTTVRKDVTSAD